MASRWMETGFWGWMFSAFVAVTALGCGESEGDDGGDGGSDTGGSSSGGAATGGSSSGGSNTGGSNTGGSAGSSATGGSGGSSTGGSAGSDVCGGCGADQMCIYQVGGPGPGRVLCAEDPVCRAAGVCDCIRDQGDCMPAAPGNEYGVMCQCDNGLE